MSEPARSGRLLWLWGIVPLVAVLELFVQWRIPHRDPSEDEWRSAAESVKAQKQDGDLVIIVPEWATQGRMYLGDAIALEDFGRFGITRYDRIVEVSVGGESSNETDGLQIESEEDHGRITVRRYRTAGKAEVIYDFLASSKQAKCVGSGCIGRRLIVDRWFNPRLSVKVALKPSPVSVIYENVPLDGTIYGHAVIGYREARFKEHGGADLKVYVDGDLVGQQRVHNWGPLETFEFPVNREGRGTVKFSVEVKGSFKREFGFAADMRKEAGK